MTSDWNLTDRTTWITILSVLAAALADIFHTSFAAYVPAAATVAAGLVVAGVALAKHHYQAAVLAAVGVAKTAAGQVTVPSVVPAAQTPPAAVVTAPAPTVAPPVPPTAPAAPVTPPVPPAS